MGKEESGRSVSAYRLKICRRAIDRVSSGRLAGGEDTIRTLKHVKDRAANPAERASDSKHYGAWDQNLTTQWHVRYGGRGIIIYWHVERNSLCRRNIRTAVARFFDFP
jgi:TnpA family transposase